VSRLLARSNDHGLPPSDTVTRFTLKERESTRVLA
jgi:hypothetical protein